MAARGWLAPVIELYVPPDPGGTEVVRAARTSFRPLLQLLDRYRSASVTVALDPGLARELLRHGQAGILQELATCVERGQVELAGGTLSHALLPRLPRREVERQLRLGHERMREAMGRSWRPQGLLPPALAWSRQVAEVAADRGLHWVLADELALGRLGGAPQKRVAALRGRPDVLLFFRDRAVSAAISAGEAVGWSDGYRVAVVPGVAFEEGNAAMAGLEKLLRGAGPMLSTLSSLTSVYSDRETVEPLPSSWRTSADELAAGVPFAAWSAPDNEIQALLWHLLHLGLMEMERLAGSDDPAFTRVRSLLDEGMHTAPFRCASARPWWDPAVVAAAAARLSAALAAGDGLLDPTVRAEALDVQTRIDRALQAWADHRTADRLRSRAVIPTAGGAELAG